MYIDDLILKLHHIGAIQFGEFTLKSGIVSPIYIDLRKLISYPEILEAVANLLWEKAEKLQFDLVCGVPYTALPIAGCLSLKHQIPMVMRRKEAKGHGTKKAVEGVYQAGQRCLVVEDLITSGISLLETAESLTQIGLQVSDAILLLDREQGGVENLREQGITVHAVFTITKMLDVLKEHGRISEDMYDRVLWHLEEHRHVSLAPTASLSYGQRAKQCKNLAGQRLLQIMEQKETNLSFNPDVLTAEHLLRLADLVGPEICLLKTHVDMVADFSLECADRLRALADKHNFLIFEDRKFADIGSVVQQQYAGGPFRIAEWADITNAHVIPGPGIIEGLKKEGLRRGRGLLLLAEMSSKGNLATGSYTAQTVALAEKHPDFVIGFVAMRKLTDHPGMIHLTPGVQLQTGEDDLGQQFKTPELVIGKQGSDIIQVGRGIYKSDDPLTAARAYRKAGWEAYEARLHTLAGAGS